MKSKKTEAQVKAQIIARINGYRETAILYGFDYPTQDIENCETTVLIDFLEEIIDFMSYTEGYNDGFHGVEPELIVTH